MKKFYDYKAILESFGYTLSDHGSYWTTKALYRSGDNQFAIIIFKESGIWKDQVEDTPYAPFTLLLQKITGSSRVKRLLPTE